MKKIFTAILAIMLIHVHVSGQKTRIGFLAGGTIANYIDKTSGKNRPKAGLMTGIIAEVSLHKRLSLQTGLIMVQKGISIKKDAVDQYSFLMSNNLIEIPLNLIMQTPAGSGKFFFGAGPSVGAVISGKMKFEGLGQYVKQHVKIGNNSDDDIRRIDIGGNLLAGFNFASKINITLNYNMGLNNLTNDGTGRLHSQYFGLSLAYLIKNRAR